MHGSAGTLAYVVRKLPDANVETPERAGARPEEYLGGDIAQASALL
jgi:hypothetical protein